ncbi:carboxypeptidase regulatory-like domain-containing protein [Halotia branconii]|uniref:Carboxypeptidase regulatory-like domain-containing protein n=1 Tax=Halotia branconii CENA392 TaxID=1539056 RepID=A0AAJ6NTF1_9CYAN|nr:carboxypeptidase regulatory-like domain-containing protein [Halotia branconii]WGV26383.1 carboxypeptidase regulatory-like domain-containing protein [Halotia branconii CENA392]
MFYQNPTPPPTVTILQSENVSCKPPLDDNNSKKSEIIAKAIAAPAAPEILSTAEFSPNDLLQSCSQEQMGKQVVAQNLTLPVASPKSITTDTKETPVEKNNDSTNTLSDNILATSQNLLLGVIINQREVGSLDVVQEGKILLLPLLNFAQLTGFTVENIDGKTQLKTPLGVVAIADDDLKEINGVTYISDIVLREKLATNIELNSADLALIVDVPWRRGDGQSSSQAAELQPEVRPASSGLSNLRQELQFTNNSGDTSWRSSTLLGGRLLDGAWRVRLDNNFVNQPDITEYFFFKRSGQFLYQVGRQQISLHPLINGVNLTGAQFGYTNLPKSRFSTAYNANELLPRRSQPVQTFRGVVPPASFVQLRVSGVIVAQQQVGLSGEYEFIDVNLPPSQTNDIELLVFDRNNPNLPVEIRSLRINVSDLLLPSGGTLQLGGLGLTGNLIQNTLFDDFNSVDSGKLAAFYQVRQGISNDLTLEGALQVLPDTTQAQAGLVWRLANPAILAASVGTSRGGIGYTADLDIQLDKLQIIGNSELFPSGYLYSNQSRDRFNHSLEFQYKFNNDFNLGVITRNYQDQSNSTAHIAPTFYMRPFSGLSLRGRPDIEGRYLFNAFYQPTRNSRLSFNTFGDVYTSDFSYNLNRDYLLSLGGEFGGNLANRYTMTLNRNARSLSGLSWRLGMAYSDGDVGPIVGASMQVLPGLFARAEYQGIPSRTRNLFGGFGDDRLTISLVSDLSFAGGRMAPSNYISIGKDRGGIAGRILVEGKKQGFDLSGSIVRVFNNRNQSAGAAKTDSQGNFFVGNLPEGVYIVEIEPEQLPVELSLKKTTIVAEVASSAVTRLDFPANLEYGMAGRITDVTGQPMSEVEVELIDAEGKRVSTTMTDQFGLYRLDGVPVGNYTLRVPAQEGITNGITLPNLQVAISKDFVYDQNLKLPVAAAVKEIKDNEPAQKP